MAVDNLAGPALTMIRSTVCVRFIGSKKGAVLPLLLGALGATRTHDPLVRNQVLYPLSYEGNSIKCDLGSVDIGSIPESATEHKPLTRRGGRDSNPRSSYKPDNHLAGGPIRPLWHLPG
jgi:hypothetical protein